ncbi:hypothetical protein TNCT_258211 [Trichonephila clavata]|uniref:Uncharacterized protein n=1 Tax=Trichonephila clavata TaxID=2740835 RepID=A0A8X6I7L2_TRICU|nr:hypothetical protein TNCT_258211 [Trichonephila clavata]
MRFSPKNLASITLLPRDAEAMTKQSGPPTANVPINFPATTPGRSGRTANRARCPDNRMAITQMTSRSYMITPALRDNNAMVNRDHFPIE